MVDTVITQSPSTIPNDASPEAVNLSPRMNNRSYSAAICG
jgi:hypothetical protein